jgi:hypothetical protein
MFNHSKPTTENIFSRLSYIYTHTHALSITLIIYENDRYSSSDILQKQETSLPCIKRLPWSSAPALGSVRSRNKKPLHQRKALVRHLRHSRRGSTGLWSISCSNKWDSTGSNKFLLPTISTTFGIDNADDSNSPTAFTNATGERRFPVRDGLYWGWWIHDYSCYLAEFLSSVHSRSLHPVICTNKIKISQSNFEVLHRIQIEISDIRGNLLAYAQCLPVVLLLIQFCYQYPEKRTLKLIKRIVFFLDLFFSRCRHKLMSNFVSQCFPFLNENMK